MTFVCLPPDHPLGKQIGAGSYGRVYLTKHEGKEYVVKITNNDDLGIGSVNEMDIMTRIRHPFILPCYGMRKGSSLNLLLPRAICDLKTFAKRHRPSTDTLLKLLYQVAVGIQFLHDHNILHLDLNWCNILVMMEEKDYVAKISDFGLAMYTDTGIETIDRKLVTSSFRAPESFVPSKGLYTYSKGNDVWALGMTMLRTLNPRLRPYNGNVNLLIKKLEHGYVNISVRYEQRIVQLINRMLTVDPKNRPDIGEVVTTLKEIVGDTATYTGYVVEVDRPVKTRCFEDYQAIDRISYAAYKMYCPTRVMFLAVDIYHRSTGSELLRAAASLGLALKAQGRDCNYPLICTIFNIQMMDIANMELSIIAQLQGVINCDTLYHRIPTGMEVAYYEYVRDASAYTQLMRCSIVNCQLEKSFHILYPKTEYWQWLNFSNQLHTDMLRELYNHEEI